MSLYAYFQKKSKSCLPNPQGPLSKQLPCSCIESANKHFEQLAKQLTIVVKSGKMGGATIRTVGGVTIITKKTRNHEIFNSKINIGVIFIVFSKFLDRENLELYGMPTIGY